MTEAWKDFVAGTAGGFAGKILDYPFDTVKVLLQTQGVGRAAAAASSSGGGGGAAAATAASSSSAAASEPAAYRGAFHCLTHTVETHGVAGLYRGISSPLLGSMAENAVLFFWYSELKRAMGEVPGGGPDGRELTLFQLSAAGAGAGAAAAFVLTPFELVKCRLQVQSSAEAGGPGGFRSYKGPIDVVVQTLKTEGLIRGLYRGNASTLLREVPGNFCWYGAYEGVCKVLTPEGGTKDDLGPSAHLLGGASAGVAYWTAFYPADTVKSRIQTHPDHATHGFWETFRQIYAREGTRGLYRGWGITIARAMPAHALIFAVYEYTIKMLRPMGKGGGGEVGFVMRESVRD